MYDLRSTGAQCGSTAWRYQQQHGLRIGLQNIHDQGVMYIDDRRWGLHLTAPPGLPVVLATVHPPATERGRAGRSPVDTQLFNQHIYIPARSSLGPELAADRRPPGNSRAHWPNTFFFARPDLVA